MYLNWVAKNRFGPSHKKKKFKLFNHKLSSFSITLTDWYRGHKRDLPWRGSSDPYPVWLSEIILQQTRVEQGLPYWERFMEAFPKIADLATASEETVLRLWQGLGYYSRARNLHATAKYIHHQLEGSFPTTYAEIIKLKGIGPYTAAAISSICFDEPKPVVDGNVFRFASRYFGIATDIASSGARVKFEEVLSAHIPKTDPGNFNQALMEFGARVCSPSPHCEDCVFRLDCFAFQQNKQKALPVKSKKVKVKKRFLNYLVIRYKDQLYFKQRIEKDIWHGLYDFALVEGQLDEEAVLVSIQSILENLPFTLEDVSETKTHLLSHQRLLARFYHVNVAQPLSKTVVKNTKIHPFSIEEILNLPKPKLIVNHLEERGII